MTEVKMGMQAWQHGHKRVASEAWRERYPRNGTLDFCGDGACSKWAGRLCKGQQRRFIGLCSSMDYNSDFVALLFLVRAV